MAGVPVEARVAAILRATWPLLPMPVTMTRPVDGADRDRPRGEARPERPASARSRPERLGLEREHAARASRSRRARHFGLPTGLRRFRPSLRLIWPVRCAMRRGRAARLPPHKMPARRGTISMDLLKTKCGGKAPRGVLRAPAGRAQCAKMSCSAQPARSSSARSGRKSKQARGELARGPRAPAWRRARA